MNKSKKKKNEWYYEWWIWAIILFLFTFIKSRTENNISPIILVIGLLCVTFSFYKIRKLKKAQSEDSEKTPNKNLNIIMIIGITLSILGYSTLGISGSIQEKEKLFKAEFIGIDEHSSPLCASNLKLFKKGNTYTVIGDFKKTSKKPAESYFDYEIILIDKYGKYIETKKVSTKPTISNDNTFFTFESSEHFEEEIYISDNNKPKTVEFSNIKEYSKQDFIDITLKEAQKLMAENNFSSAQQYIDLVLKYTPTTEELQKLLEQAQQGIVPSTQTTPIDIPKEETYIIGSDKETVRAIFKDYKEKSSLMGENAIDFDSKDLLVTVFFNDGKADGVIFLSNNLDDMNTLTGEGSYVSKHYDELLKMATNDDTIKIETDLTKYNSKGNKKAVAELYIGNTPYNDEKSSAPSSSKEPKQETNAKAENKEENEFSYCLESGIRVGVKIYLKPSNDTYVGTISAFSDDMYDERGKKAKGVYLSNGVKDGWYKRSDIKKCYVRKDDPNLPSDRLVY